MNLTGVIAAVTAFLGIWAGHVVVRRLEANSPTTWLPVTAFVVVGLGLEWIAFTASSPLASMVPGILGMTLLWDALEVVRQEGRVRRGHAPANPANPRHRRMLAAPGAAATRVYLSERESP